MIRFHCEHCRRKIGIGDGSAGRSVRCPHCGEPTRVPDADAATEPEAEASSPLTEALDLESAAETDTATEPAPPLPQAPQVNTPRKRSAWSAMPNGRQIGLIAGVGGALIVAIVLLVAFTGGDGHTDDEAADASGVATGDSPPPRLDVEPMPRQPEPEPPTAPEPEPTEPTAAPNEPSPPAEPEPEPRPQPPPEPEPEPDPYQAEFAGRVDAAKQTPNIEDDRKLLADLAAAVAGGELTGENVGRSLAVIGELAGRHMGLRDTAVQALRRIGRNAPDHRADALGRAVELCRIGLNENTSPKDEFDRIVQLYIDLGDAQLAAFEPQAALASFKRAYELGRFAEAAPFPEIMARRDLAQQRIERQKEIDQLVARIEANPDDAAAAERLVRIYLMEFDRPDLAQTYAAALPEGQLKRVVNLANRQTAALDNDQLLTLAQAYAGYGGQDDQPNPAAMYLRAKHYYEQYLRTYTVQDETRTQAYQAKQQVDQALLDLGVGMKQARRQVKKLRGEEVEDDKPTKIDEAIARGVKWLYDQHDAKLHWEDTDTYDADDRNWAGRTSLAAYALTTAGEDPEDNPQLKAAIGWLFAQNVDGTYTTCFRMHLWETLGEDARIDRIARRDLMRSFMCLHQTGTYGYRMQRPTERGDLSTTLAGGLAMWLGRSNGLPGRGLLWAKLAARMVLDQRDDGGWAYRPNRNASTQQMTAAALTVLLMARDLGYLKQHKEVHERADDAIKQGLYWLNTHYNPNPGGRWPYYNLAAVQHVGLLSETRQFNGKDWYQSAADAMVASQTKDGSWGGDLVKTSFAVVFLARGGIDYDAYLDDAGN